jgi:hypothetical protein
MAHWPVRTGLVSLHALLRKACQLIAKYRPVMVEILTPEQLNKVDAVLVACEAFITEVPSHEPIV